MINDLMLDAINEIEFFVNEKKEKLFGGKNVFLVGDLFQLPTVSTVQRPVKKMSESNLFLNDFKPFLLETYVRQTGDIVFQRALNNCRIGKLKEEDISLFKQRVCGEGHSITEECTQLSNTTNLCSLHLLRKQKIGHINKKKAIESRPKFFNSLDVDSIGHRLSNFYSDLIDKIPGSLERMLEIYPDNP
ncbi:ATP-dependent DNA helicase PIF1 [Brachionus plicatilis]|uniref:ATP-dependent DNA helicase PIF1 n=1 Tax=Brachionus plicatilis TaxID=10195 RepID=A0A3M7PQP8_BRAPC|nr:ATP-dependent DNA helicase PIF1 [Brachionus plicatilis]